MTNTPLQRQQSMYSYTCRNHPPHITSLWLCRRHMHMRIMKLPPNLIMCYVCAFKATNIHIKFPFYLIVRRRDVANICIIHIIICTYIHVYIYNRRQDEVYAYITHMKIYELKHIKYINRNQFARVDALIYLNVYVYNIESFIEVERAYRKQLTWCIRLLCAKRSSNVHICEPHNSFKVSRARSTQQMNITAPSMLQHCANIHSVAFNFESW